jgi:hypothetical protein
MGRSGTWPSQLKQASLLPSPCIPRLAETFRIEASSSDFATGAILSQISLKMTIGTLSHSSKSPTPVEELRVHDTNVAIVRALQEWRHFVEGAEHQCEIWTDHKNLEYFMTAKQLNRRQARWSLYLSRFDFTLHHKPGKSMGKPDALSRRADHGTGEHDNSNPSITAGTLRDTRDGSHAVLRT